MMTSKNPDCSLPDTERESFLSIREKSPCTATNARKQKEICVVMGIGHLFAYASWVAKEQLLQVWPGAGLGSTALSNLPPLYSV